LATALTSFSDWASDAANSIVIDLDDLSDFGVAATCFGQFDNYEVLK
jgi:hypothetical protein